MSNENKVVWSTRPEIGPSAIADLREAVGWDRLDAEYREMLPRYWSTVAGFNSDGILIAWCELISDGRQHAVLLNVIVHPVYQRQGLGRELVGRALKQCKERKVASVHVDFLPEHQPFYERCGFKASLAGIYQS